ncbi:MAG: hypothetical protein N5P05_002029 [Chroococcopsis gigantea SAG 12.99]|jgi:hypothetical protein|nr:hypothetical protein [Chlorogloea purpurea SAG 13.99]MDV3000423.1 hypothetical protein [Chroococcopsis gigantea SAG 12.99]
MYISKWISFFRKYGPIPRNDNMYDETIQVALKKNNIQPIKFPTPYLQELIYNFRSDCPKSVILTGTAGDGKTYSCREVWEQLGGLKEHWEIDEKVKTFWLASRELIIIKDLSELDNEEKNNLIPQIAEAIINENHEGKIFLIAANDGQLMEAWHIADCNPNIQKARKLVEKLLVEDKREEANYNLLLYNLSRLNNEEVFTRIIEAVLTHPGWQQCQGCPYQSQGDISQSCPIWENKTRLEGNKDRYLMKQRIIDLLQLLRHNGMHLPIRQLLLLVANLILGHSKAADGLLACKQVPEILQNRTAYLGSIYSNCFGENLSVRKRNKTDVFVALRYLGIGAESNNLIDNLLIFGEDDDEVKNYYEELVTKDSYYGIHPAFHSARKNYVEGNGNTDDKEAFIDMLQAQRQRLFFTVPEEKAEELKLWELTAFHYSGDYLDKVCRRLKTRNQPPKKLLSQLVKGLNRIFTGLLINNDDELILATSGSYSQARSSRVFEEFLSVSNKRGESVTIEFNSNHNTPDLVVSFSYHPEIEPVKMRLNLTRYEYLLRVSAGALPSNFSQECYEDILAFKTRLLSQLNLRREKEGYSEDSTGEMVIRLLEIKSDGFVQPVTLEISL